MAVGSLLVYLLSSWDKQMGSLSTFAEQGKKRTSVAGRLKELGYGLEVYSFNPQTFWEKHNVDK